MRALFTLAFLAMGCRDVDGDGTRDGRDCAPDDPAIHPGAKEVCDGVDNDCSGQIDERVSIDAYLDRDLDGYGDDAFKRRVCELPDNGSLEGGDCDDFDPATGPGAPERCDGVDQDCDGEVDEGVSIPFFADADGDGHGAPGPTTGACWASPGWSATADDCDDAEPLAWAGAPELCDGVDNDCNGEVDEDLPLLRQWLDEDGDGSGASTRPVLACGPKPGVSADDLDCDDADPLRGPDAIEVRGNDVDEDCDAYFDEYGVGPGNEYATVEDALAVAPDGSVVQLDAGFYVLRVDLRGHHVTFAGEGCDRTTLYADSAGTAVRLDGGTLTRMTIQGGSGTLGGDGVLYGGGVLITSGAPVLEDLCVTGNAAGLGAGIAAIGGSVALDGVLVADNTATSEGGGVYVRYPATAVTVVHSRLLANQAVARGAGMAVRGTVATIEGTVFAGNEVDARGAGLFAGEYATSETHAIAGDVTVTHCTFHANSAGTNGVQGGVAALAEGAALRVDHTLFTGHPDPYIVLDRSTAGLIKDRPLTTAYVGFRDNAGPDFDFDTFVLDRVAADPEYVLADPALPATTWDLRLRASSGFVDAGDPAILDPDGSPADLGAYGGHAAPDGWDFGLVADDDADGLLDGWEIHRGLNVLLDDAADDPDGDGLSNVEEFGLDTHPLVADSDADGVTDAVEVAGASDPNRPQDNAPVPDAGLDRQTLVGEPVVLDGGASFDPDLDLLAYSWSILSAPLGSVATLGGAGTASATLVPDLPGEWTIALEVDDGAVLGTDLVTVRAWDGVVVPDDHPTVQEALAAIVSGEAVGVRPGTWVGPLDTGGLDIAIVGLGAADEVVLDGNAQGSAIRAIGGSLTLASLTVTGGFAPSLANGGGIYAHGVDRLELFDVTVRDNRAIDGGGVWASVPDGSVRVLDSRILDNVAEGSGGGLWILGENTKLTLEIARSLLAGNRAAAQGGALRYDGGTLTDLDADVTVEATAFADNEAADGAALWHSGAGSDHHAWNVAFVGHRGGSVGWGDEGRVIVLSDAMQANATPLFFDAGLDADGIARVTWQHLSGVWTDVPATPWYPGAGLVAELDTAVVADPLLAWIDDGDPLDDVLAPRGGSAALDAGFLDHLDPDGSRADVGPCGGPVALPRCARFAHDADGDGMGDGWEVAVGLDPVTADGGMDDDGDGLTNAEEHAIGSLPLVADSDRDGVDDGVEDASLGDPVRDEHRPVAVVAAEVTVVGAGTLAALDGSGSFDPDGDPITFAWRVIAAPPGSAITTASLTGAATATPSFLPDVQGAYRLGLTTADAGATSREVFAYVRVP